MQQRRSQSREARGGKAEEPWRCRLCPYKSFLKAQHLLNHLDKQHVNGTKHAARGCMSFVRAVFDAAASKTVPWDLMTPAGACGVALSKDFDWKGQVSDRPLAETARRLAASANGIDCHYRALRVQAQAEGGGRRLWHEVPAHHCMQHVCDHAESLNPDGGGHMGTGI